MSRQKRKAGPGNDRKPFVAKGYRLPARRTVAGTGVRESAADRPAASLLDNECDEPNEVSRLARFPEFLVAVTAQGRTALR